MTKDPLPSWNDGPTKRAIAAFLAAARDVPVEDRVAVLDNDGTLWCEKPNYPQLEFLLSELAGAVRADPTQAQREEYRALIEGDAAAQSELGLERIALALIELCAGISPQEFDARVRGFFATARHRERGVAFAALRYQPMLELLDELRRAEFDVFLVTGGGTEFVRAIGIEFYGVTPERVVGTQANYDFVRDTEGRAGPAKKIFDVLTPHGIPMASMGPVYDRVHFPGMTIEFEHPAARLVETLKVRFPSEAAGIDRYFDSMRAAGKALEAVFAAHSMPQIVARGLMWWK